MDAEHKICLKYVAKKRRKTSVGARKEARSDKDLFLACTFLKYMERKNGRENI